MPDPVAGIHPPLTISFPSGFPGTPHSIKVGLPILGGSNVEAMFSPVEPAGREAGFNLYRQNEWLVGYSVNAVGHDVESQTFALYRSLLNAMAGRNLCRIWNYVPGINTMRSSGVETYHEFSHGRSRAFEEHFGPGFEHKLPAASAVGTEDDQFVILFAANAGNPTHFENPQQVPAYEYPPEHGPRSPSFARATVMPRNDEKTDVFISGTAAIRGHETRAPGDTARQLECTLQNLREISQVCDLGSDFAEGRALTRHFKVYIRNPEDMAFISASLEERLITATDHATYLRADICRAALNLEIETTIIGADLD